MPSQRTIKLAHSLKDTADTLYDAYINETGHLADSPADSLPGVIKLLGWKLKMALLPADRDADCSPAQKVIRLTSDLKARLEYPEQAKKVAHRAVAHELGHAVLHSAPRKSRTVPKSWEFEANIFSQVYLVPWRFLGGRSELLALRGNLLTQKERWARIHALAEDFKVTPTFMKGCLFLYGVLVPSPGGGGGIEAPSDVLITPARPWRTA